MQRLALIAALTALVPTTVAHAQERKSVAPKSMQDVAPALADYTDNVLFGDVWLRPELSPRDRSIVTVSALIAMGKAAQLKGHTNRALTNGVKPTEIAGLATHLAFYTGWPNAVSALEVIDSVFLERKVDFASLKAAAGPDGTVARVQRTANPQITAMAPKFEQLTSDVLFGSLWLRTDLSPRDRSLVTISALAATGSEPQLASHIKVGMTNGLTRAEIMEAFTHLAFYAGWAKANSAIRVAIPIFEAAPQPAAPAKTEKLVVVPKGSNPAVAPASNFVGSVTTTSRFKGTGDSRLGGATVTFQPGAHTKWHSHPLGQLLIVTAGRGWVQAEGEPVREIKAGDTVWTAANVKHWHGATKKDVMTHVGVSEALNGETATWLEPLSDGQYHGPQ